MTSEDAERSEASSEMRAGSEATREQSDSGERSEADSEASSSGEDAEADDVASMLNIVGHADRERPGDGDSPFGSSDPETDSTAAEGEEDDPYPEAAGVAAETMEEVLPDEDEVGDTEEEEEVEPVEVLVNLAKSGEIDPWDIDVVRVTDKFLDALDEADLRTSGRALFYASVLVRMKGDELLHGSEDDEEEEVAPWEAPFADGPEQDGGEHADFDPVASLEAEMERRLDRKHARGTPETLDELVRELREAERGSWWKRQREYDTSDSPSGFQRGEQTLDYRAADDFRVDDEPTEQDVTGTTHEEDIEAVIEDVQAVLREQYDAGRTEVLFGEVADAGGSRVQTFLAVLFMSHRGVVRLQQDELFGDLWVQDPNAVTASESAAAD